MNVVVFDVGKPTPAFSLIKINVHDDVHQGLLMVWRWGLAVGGLRGRIPAGHLDVFGLYALRKMYKMNG
jgi:hypothetical protein